MIFDYVMNPIICVIWCSKAAMNFIPEIPFAAYAVFFAVLFTGMNLRGIEASTRTNTIIGAGLGVVIVLFLGAVVRYLWLQPPAGLAGWTRPFYDPQTYSFSVVSGGAALAQTTDEGERRALREEIAQTMAQLAAPPAAAPATTSSPGRAGKATRRRGSRVPGAGACST